MSLSKPLDTKYLDGISRFDLIKLLSTPTVFGFSIEIFLTVLTKLNFSLCCLETLIFLPSYLAIFSATLIASAKDTVSSPGFSQPFCSL